MGSDTTEVARCGEGWRLENTYAELPDALFAAAVPARFQNPQLAVLNEPLARQLGLDFTALNKGELAQLFSGQALPSGAKPIAQAYAGHQFGGFTMLGDGRALLLGEQRTPTGELFDLQFKGSGPTPFSRRGDGLAALGPMLREYIISEALSALGVPTTRSLAVATTGEPVYRETKLDGAVLTRMAASHIRVGTFQFLAAKKDEAALRRLVDYTIERHYPELAESENPPLGLLRAVMERQAKLIAQWQQFGFIHGVMNTDNMSIAGESIDFGPCAFMDAFHSQTVFSSIDQGGRYAYGQQPTIAQWNLARFAETLLPLLDEPLEKAIELATDLIHQYPAIFESNWLRAMRGKLGLSGEREEDQQLIDDLLAWMQSSQADYTNTFDDLTTRDDCSVGAYDDASFQSWRVRWIARISLDGAELADAQELMRQYNPAIIPRNHRVEEALSAATQEGDLSVMHNLLAALARPFVRDNVTAAYQTPPPAGQCYQTYCGT